MLRSSTLATIYFAKARFCNLLSTNSLFLVPLDQDPILVRLGPKIETLRYLFYTTKMLFILYITTFTIHYISCITFFILLRVILKFSFFFPFLSPIIHGQSIKSSFTYGVNCNNVIDMRWDPNTISQLQLWLRQPSCWPSTMSLLMTKKKE